MFYLSDGADTMRLSEAGTIEPAHQCRPRYFDTADDAYSHGERHPAAAHLKVRFSETARHGPRPIAAQDSPR